MKYNRHNISNEFRNVSYDTFQSSYSPLFSDIGLGVHSNCIGEMWFHYNRATVTVFDKLIDYNGEFYKADSGVDELVFSSARLAFFKKNAFIFETEEKTVNILCGQTGQVLSLWETFSDEHTLLLHGFACRNDDRDPDKTVPFKVGVFCENGEILSNKGTYTVISNGESKLKIVFAVQLLECNEEELLRTVKSAPDIEKAKEISRSWAESCFNDLDVNIEDEKEKQIFVNALKALLFNLTKAPGATAKYISQYPNRGTYPCHFLWDTCFQNLAFEKLNIDIAKDGMLQLARNQRTDGKYPQFMCSTWQRPEFSQPALVGWASKRIYDITGDKEFAAVMLDSIDKNNNWWLNARLTPCGLVSCPDGLETGQDDSPRFDNGDTVSCDMNSFLLSQMRTAAYFALQLGQKVRADKLNKQAEAFAQKMLDILWCEEDGVFYDVSCKNGDFVKIVSSTSFVPLWAGVPLNEKKKADTINKYLLSAEYLFGSVPFPSVAYNQESYSPGLWWRGPTWLPIAWIMLELLQKEGYIQQYMDAKERLFRMITNDGKLSELFNSQTGEGLGSAEQGWTAAIYIRMICDNNK